MDLKKYFTSAGGSRIMDIAYSTFPGIPGNSEIHFKEAIRRGFHGMKADMRLSRDGEIVLCHDAGYTFDQEGKITDFSEDSYTEIHDLTMEEISSLRFARPFNGVSWKPCTLAEMLRLCRDNDRIAYLTLRNEPWRPETAARMADLLDRFDMTDRTIINLFPPQPEALPLIRELCPGVPYCHTLLSSTPLSEQLITDSADKGYSIICLCGRTYGTFDRKLADLAAKAGIHIWCWGIQSAEGLTAAVQCGAAGFQMFMPEGTLEMLAELFPGQVELS